MPDDNLMPWQIIQNLFRERESWSDEQILEELRSLPVLPDEDYYYNAEEDEEYKRMALALDTYLAIVDLARARHLIDAIPLLLERASYGDFGETMRSLPDCLYHIADIGGSAMDRLRPFAVEATRSPYPGARLWAINTLRDPDDPLLVDVLLPMLDDPAIIVAAEAASMLEYYAAHHPKSCLRILAALIEARDKRPELNTNKWSRIDGSIERVQRVMSGDA